MSIWEGRSRWRGEERGAKREFFKGTKEMRPPTAVGTMKCE